MPEMHRPLSHQPKGLFFNTITMGAHANFSWSHEPLRDDISSLIVSLPFPNLILDNELCFDLCRGRDSVPQPNPAPASATLRVGAQSRMVAIPVHPSGKGGPTPAEEGGI